MNPDINFIINLLRSSENLSATEISAKIELGLRTTQRLLQDLQQNQTILKTGHGKNTVYSLSPLGILNYETDTLVDLDESRLEKPIINFNLGLPHYNQFK